MLKHLQNIFILLIETKFMCHVCMFKW